MVYFGHISAKYRPVSEYENTQITYEIRKGEKETFMCYSYFSIFDSGNPERPYHMAHSLRFYNKDMVLFLEMEHDKFLLAIENELGYEEHIGVFPMSSNKSYMQHRLAKREADGHYSHLDNTVISDFADDPSNLTLLCLEEKDGNIVKLEKKNFVKTNYNFETHENDREVIFQLGWLIQNYDPQMYKKISDIRELLTCGNVSLLDSFISLSLGSFTNTEIEVLLGIKRKPLKYWSRIRKLNEVFFLE